MVVGYNRNGFIISDIAVCSDLFTMEGRETDLPVLFRSKYGGKGSPKNEALETKM
jgi:hypothetical protein